MILRPLPVQSDYFTWCPKSRRFVAGASDLSGSFGRVYDDACDEGLTFVSTRRAGEEIVFVVNHEERDRDGDIRYWDLVPASLTLRQTVPFSLRVYND